MTRGHVTGKKREKRGSSDWYAALDDAHCRAVEAAWAPYAQVEDVRHAETGSISGITLTLGGQPFFFEREAQALYPLAECPPIVDKGRVDPAMWTTIVTLARRARVQHVGGGDA